MEFSYAVVKSADEPCWEACLTKIRLCDLLFLLFIIIWPKVINFYNFTQKKKEEQSFTVFAAMRFVSYFLVFFSLTLYRNVTFCFNIAFLYPKYLHVPCPTSFMIVTYTLFLLFRAMFTCVQLWSFYIFYPLFPSFYDFPFFLYRLCHFR